MQYKILGSALLVTSGLLFGSAAWAVDQGTMLGNTCAGCHGTHGSSVGPATPNLAGMSKDTLIEAMETYASGERKSTIMGRIAKGYTKAEIEAMADFFSKQTLKASAQEFDADKAADGAKLHEEYCEKCHEDGGKKDEDGSSLLASQWMPYLQFSFEDFESGNREAPKKMKTKVNDMVKEHGPESIEKVIHFYGSQK